MFGFVHFALCQTFLLAAGFVVFCCSMFNSKQVNPTGVHSIRSFKHILRHESLTKAGTKYYLFDTYCEKKCPNKQVSRKNKVY